jgi:hypothetical protein
MDLRSSLAGISQFLHLSEYLPVLFVKYSSSAAAANEVLVFKVDGLGQRSVVTEDLISRTQLDWNTEILSALTVIY